MENLLPLSVGSIIILSTTFSNATDVAQLATTSCNRIHPATDNDVRDGRYNSLAVTPTLYMAVSPERNFHMQMRATNQDCSKGK